MKSPFEHPMDVCKRIKLSREVMSDLHSMGISTPDALELMNKDEGFHDWPSYLEHLRRNLIGIFNSKLDSCRWLAENGYLPNDAAYTGLVYLTRLRSFNLKQVQVNKRTFILGVEKT